jgi:hypothetical protein
VEALSELLQKASRRSGDDDVVNIEQDVGELLSMLVDEEGDI